MHHIAGSLLRQKQESKSHILKKSLTNFIILAKVSFTEKIQLCDVPLKNLYEFAFFNWEK